ncbi:39S ribosomal protein L39, mitochondrial isoform X1 [Polypterus senegalus]|uniref:39S ribosomal protein L39, mitochondrial isoform X1 n=2 Tax=Polypterus senegalus TaxID=55291 RepID=UPI001965E696|nr:39S ribosomal protein L39, mitochondrial isoform X1 [Polypterus senegalus]
MACRASCLLRPWRLMSSTAASRPVTHHPSTPEIQKLRNEMFSREKARQQSLIPRIEKIEVQLVGDADPGTMFIMNKGLSTPYSCAKHLSEWYTDNSVLALVNGEVWDMNRPLTQSCEIKFLTFKDQDPEEVNKAYWRSCAMMLGYVVETAFKEEFSVELLQSPEVPVVSGAFCYDVVLDSQLNSWKPTQENLQSFTKEVNKLIHQNLPFEALDVEPKVALDIFQHSRYKKAQVEEKASGSPQGTVRVYRFGEFVDLSDGPHISRTGLCSLYEVTAAHILEHQGPWGHVHRFQGLSLPRQLRVFYHIWERLRRRARNPVEDADPRKTEDPREGLTTPHSSSETQQQSEHYSEKLRAPNSAAVSRAGSRTRTVESSNELPVPS